MKFILLVLLSVIFISCTDKAIKERINLANVFVNHPDKINIIRDSTFFNCDHSKNKIIFDKKIIERLNSKKYAFLKDNILFFQNDIENGKSILRKIDTLHYIVFRNKSIIDDDITFVFQLINKTWCLDTVYNINVLDFHIDY